jgi:hypothetical protein
LPRAPRVFYEIAGDHLVLSFVQEPSVLNDALPRILGVLDDLAEGKREELEDRRGE